MFSSAELCTKFAWGFQKGGFVRWEISIIRVVRALVAIINLHFFVRELLIESYINSEILTRIWRESNHCNRRARNPNYWDFPPSQKNPPWKPLICTKNLGLFHPECSPWFVLPQTVPFLVGRNTIPHRESGPRVQQGYNIAFNETKKNVLLSATKIAHRRSVAIFSAEEGIAGNSAARTIFTHFLRRRRNRGSLAIFFAEQITHLGASKNRAMLWGAVKIAAAAAENRAILGHSACAWEKDDVSETSSGEMTSIAGESREAKIDGAWIFKAKPPVKHPSLQTFSIPIRGTALSFLSLVVLLYQGKPLNLPRIFAPCRTP